MLLKKDKMYVFDGAKGTYLHEHGLSGGESAEIWNLTHKDVIKTMYKAYVDAGAEVLQTNTFPGNSISMALHGIDDCYEANYEGVRLAKEVAGDNVYVAGCTGPVNGFLEPSGTLKFETCVNAFKRQFEAFKDGGADLINFSTFTDLAQVRCGIIAIKETINLPFITSLTFENCRTLAGNSAECCAIVGEALGAELTGLNCGTGPDDVLEPLVKMQVVSNIQLTAKPNAGLPQMVDGKATYSLKPEELAKFYKNFIAANVQLLGTCCGSTPEHISALAEKLANEKTKEIINTNKTYVCSAYEHTANFDYTLLPLKAFEENFKNGDFEDLADEIEDAENASVTVLDFSDMQLNFDMWELVSSISVFVKKPLGVKSSDKAIIEKFLRYYCGRALAIVSEDMQDICDYYGALRKDI